MTEEKKDLKATITAGAAGALVVAAAQFVGRHIVNETAKQAIQDAGITRAICDLPKNSIAYGQQQVARLADHYADMPVPTEFPNPLYDQFPDCPLPSPAPTPWQTSSTTTASTTTPEPDYPDDDVSSGSADEGERFVKRDDPMPDHLL